MLYSADTVFKVVHLPLSYYQTIVFSQLLKGRLCQKPLNWSDTYVYLSEKRLVSIKLHFLRMKGEGIGLIERNFQSKPANFSHFYRHK